MQTQKEQCEVFSYFYSKCAELGIEVAHKLVQFRVAGDSSWFPFLRGFCQLPHGLAEYRIDPFYKDWKFEPFTLTVEIFDDDFKTEFKNLDCDNDAVNLDIDIYGLEAFDNMGLFTNEVECGRYEISGVLEIGPDEVHYTCTHKKL